MSSQQRETLVGIASNEASVKRVVRGIAASGTLLALAIGLRSLMVDHMLHAAVLFGFAATMLLNEFILFFYKNDELYKTIFSGPLACCCSTLLPVAVSLILAFSGSTPSPRSFSTSWALEPASHSLARSCSAC